MSQQINLFNPSLIRPRDWLTLKNVALIYLVAFAVMYGLYSQAQGELTELTTEQQAAQTSLEAAKLELSVVKSRASQATNSKDDEQALKTLIETKDMQFKMLSILKVIQNDGDQHILDYMQGFAEQAVKGVWLTGFKLNNFEQQLSILGQSLSPELVPAYVEKLGHHPVFHGRLFSGLVLKEMPLPGGESKPVEPQATNTASVEAATDKSAANVVVTQASQPVNIISFEFKGEKYSAGNDQSAMPANSAVEGDLKK